MAANSIFEMLILSSWFVLPVGVPPGPADPMLAKMAPEKCLYYISSSGTVAPDPDSDNRTEKLLLDPEVKEFVEQLIPRIQKSMQQMLAAQGAPPEANVVAQTVPTLIETLLTEPVAIYIEDVRLQPGGQPDLRGAMIVNIARSKQEVTKALASIQVFADQVTQPVDIGGVKYSRIDMGQMGPGMPSVTYGVSGDYFLLGIGDDSIAGALKRQQTAPPAWLTEAEKLLDVPRRSSLAYADTKAIVAAARPAIGQNQMVDQLLLASGFGQVNSYINVTGLDKNGWVGRTLVQVTGKPTGWLALLGEKPLGPDDIADVPDDALLAFAARMDPELIVDGLRSFFQLVGDDDNFDEIVLGIKQLTGVDIEEELIPQLGDVWQVHTTPREGDLITGWTASVSIKDRAKVSGVSERIVDGLRAMFANQPRAPRLKTNEFAGNTLYTLIVPDDDFMAEPTWCVTKDRVVIAAYPQAIKAYLRGREKALSVIPEVNAVFQPNRAPTFLFYNDTPAILRRVYPLVQMGLSMLIGQMQREGFDLDLSLLPSCDAIARHLRPGTQTARWTKQGLYTESRQTLPTGNFGAVMPLALVNLIPAGMQARHAAQRNQGMNNLRQIALAMLNFESAYGAYPARYNTDANGKPLLSWRVHILPFIEEQALYEQFKLDEPWSSPNNRKLIARMPAVFRAPGSLADPGKATYLAFESEGSVITAPTENETNKGRQIREVLDGTSKTLLVVSVNEQSAVIWTKPDDYEPDEENPFQGLLDRRGFFQAAFCDGHVRSLTPTIRKETLKLLIDVSDGQPVPPF